MQPWALYHSHRERSRAWGVPGIITLLYRSGLPLPILCRSGSQIGTLLALVPLPNVKPPRLNPCRLLDPRPYFPPPPLQCLALRLHHHVNPLPHDCPATIKASCLPISWYDQPRTERPLTRASSNAYRRRHAGCRDGAIRITVNAAGGWGVGRDG